MLGILVSVAAKDSVKAPVSPPLPGFSEREEGEASVLDVFRASCNPVPTGGGRASPLAGAISIERLGGGAENWKTPHPTEHRSMIIPRTPSHGCDERLFSFAGRFSNVYGSRYRLTSQ